MSNLYIRVKTGFYNHRKTIKLKALIGDDAYWVPPRLWAYAAEHQPDGDLSSYDSFTLAQLIGCYKHATSILEALKTSGYVTPEGKIHDWDDHNGYHQRFSIRAKKAAAAMHEKRRLALLNSTKEKEESGDKQCYEHACSIYSVFPRKVGKPAAVKAIMKAMQEFGYEFLLERTTAYAKAREGQDPQYTPHPSTWFNQHRFNDDFEAVELQRPKVPYTPNLG